MAALRILWHQLKRHVVCDCITLQTGGQAILERGISLNNERISIDPDEKVGAEFSFRGKNQGSDRLARHQAAKIVAQLTVEIPETVRAGYANASARSREEKSSLPAKMS